MIKLIPLIIFLFSWQVLKGQPDNGYLELIESRMRHLQSCGTLYYADRLPKEIIRRDIENFNQQGIDTFFGKQISREFQLTGAEWETIRLQVIKAIDDSLPDLLFANSRSIAVDSLHGLVEAHNKAVRDSVIQLPTAQRPQAPCVLKWTFYFSKPMYIRNQTILFYFFMYYRGSSGSHAFYLSKQKDGRWEKGLFVTGGDW